MEVRTQAHPKNTLRALHRAPHSLPVSQIRFHDLAAAVPKGLSGRGARRPGDGARGEDAVGEEGGDDGAAWWVGGKSVWVKEDGSEGMLRVRNEEAGG